MKNYTDIEQSKKLVKILSLESADAFYPWRELMKDYDSIYVPEKMLVSDLEEYDICAWSLAALLDILPKIHNLRPILDLEENSIQYSGIDLYIIAGSPIDACYEMILKLHELNLL